MFLTRIIASLGIVISMGACASPPANSVPNHDVSGFQATSSTYTPSSDSGGFAVEVQEGVWTERRRLGRREVPWRAYLPNASVRAAPVVVFSHGLGGSRLGSETLGRHLASHGIAVFHIQHPGTDTAALQEKGFNGLLRSLGKNPRSVIDRFADVSFAVNQIERLAEQDLIDRIDASQIGMSGHSFGAITALMAAGQSGNSRLVGQRFAEPRFKAAFVMSPSPPRGGSAAEAFKDMLMPLFHLSGTNDTSPVGDLGPADREIPFQIIDDVDQYFLSFDGGTHFTYTDTEEFRGRSLSYPAIERHRAILRATALAYWDAYLRGDLAAASWLQDGGLAAYVGSDAAVIYKAAAKT